MCVVNELVNIGVLSRKALGEIVIGGVYGGKECDGVECSK